MNAKTAQLVDKIDKLPPAQVREVIDFVDFLKKRSEEQQIRHDMQAASEPSLKRVWDNSEDDIYNDL